MPVKKHGVILNVEKQAALERAARSNKRTLRERTFLASARGERDAAIAATGASGEMRALLAERGAAASMNRRGNCYDNARMESFRATLKAECLAGERPVTRQAATLQIFDYIEDFYNRTRLHSSLGCQSPLAFERTISYGKN